MKWVLSLPRAIHACPVKMAARPGTPVLQSANPLCHLSFTAQRQGEEHAPIRCTRATVASGSLYCSHGMVKTMYPAAPWQGWMSYRALGVSTVAMYHCNFYAATFSSRCCRPADAPVPGIDGITDGGMPQGQVLAIAVVTVLKPAVVRPLRTTNVKQSTRVGQGAIKCEVPQSLPADDAAAIVPRMQTCYESAPNELPCCWAEQSDAQVPRTFHNNAQHITKSTPGTLHTCYMR